MNYTPITFPRDGGPHKAIVEWWYYNGFLTSKEGRRFAYMMCLFKVDNKKVGIPVLSRIPIKTVYFAHSLLTDIDNQKFEENIEYFSVISRDSFKRPLMFVNFLNPLGIKDGYLSSVIKENKMFDFHLKRDAFDLRLTNTKQPLLEGGNGFLKLHDRTTYYYSLTNLKTEGLVFVDNKIIEVAGKSWMDHQWADVSFANDKWTWFSLQLDNNIEIVCFEHGVDNKSYLASISYPDGHAEHTENVIIKPVGDSWYSKKTKAEYFLEYKIEIPEKKMEFSVRPPVKNQEMIFGSINYWEGPLEVAGHIEGTAVRGQGFMELVGRPAQYSNLRLAADDAWKKIKKIKVFK